MKLSILQESQTIQSILFRFFGWKISLLFGDPSTFDRFNWLKRYLKGGMLRTLDAGCGTGAFTFYAAGIGNESLGISFDKRNTEVANARAQLLDLKNAKFIQLDLRDLPRVTKDIGLFDQIICFETIEHIMDDFLVIKNLSNLLKVGGKLILTAPYKHYNHLLGDKLSLTEDGGHVRWGYTHEEIENLFTANGLELEVKEYISGFFTQQLINLQRILSYLNWLIASIIIFPLRVIICFDIPFTRIINYPFLSIGVVGVKR